MDLFLPLMMGAVVGFFLGFFGSGGSVMAVPILVYVLGMPPKEAIASSLAIVGATAVSGSVQKLRSHQVCFKIGVIFALFGVAGAFSGARLSVYLSGTQQLVIFSILMLVSALSMWFKKQSMSKVEGDACQMASYLAASLGFGVGLLTGLVGVGGGFLIVPALVMLGGLNLRMAMGTSLFIIALNALSALVAYLGIINFNWEIILIFILASSLASMLGAKLSNKVDGEKMKKLFSVFIFLLGILLLIKNLRGSL
ncbi:MAG: sulfite exporter TauE/SafE family protein [Deltaproteobacteria bacterium]|nr:sulfite exporter TauE/SafE family protein [Deltaproteobacteria bacterium]